MQQRHLWYKPGRDALKQLLLLRMPCQGMHLVQTRAAMSLYRLNTFSTHSLLKLGL